MAIWPRNKEPYYISILKYLEEKSDDGVGANEEEVIARIKPSYPNISEWAISNIFRSAAQLSVDASSDVRLLSLEAHFQLLEHEELKQARVSSSLASFLSFVAIGVAVWAIVIQAYDSNVVLLNGEQVKEIIRLVTEVR